MKTLLLKEWYTARVSFLSYCLLSLVFLTVSLFAFHIFFVLYPAYILGGIFQISLLSYDEKNGWLSYGATLPYTRRQLVEAKYLAGLIPLLASLLVPLLLQGGRALLAGGIDGRELFAVPVLALCGAACNSLCLPVVFRYGAKKGGFVYYLMVGTLCGASGAMALKKDGAGRGFFAWITSLPWPVLPGITLASILLLLLSFTLSVRFFEKREL